MEPRIAARAPFAVLGVATRVSRGSESPELFTRIWKEFESYRQRIAAVAIGRHYFGVSFPTDQEGETDYVAGMMVGDDAPVLPGLDRRTVSGGQFAVFECRVEAIGAMYQHIFTVWAPGATVRFDPAVPVFEEYPESTAQQPVCIHVPLRQEREASQDAG
jgi:predicted transcriptional regulator YdeE